MNGPRMAGENMGMPGQFKGMPGPVPGPMPPMRPVDYKAKAQQLLRDKNRICEMDVNAGKRVLADCLKGLAEEQKMASSADASRYISRIQSNVDNLLKDMALPEVFVFFEKPEAFRDAMNRQRQN